MINRASAIGMVSVLLTVVLAACTSATPAPDQTAPPSMEVPTPSPTELATTNYTYEGCTLIGNAEGISVDLAGVLDPNGGDYYAEVRVDSLDATSTVGFAGNDDYGRSGGVQADLTAEAVRVDVIVRSTHGPDGDPATATEVYRASGDVTPELFQPNGAQCDGENYAAAARATKSGELVTVPVE